MKTRIPEENGEGIARREQKDANIGLFGTSATLPPIISWSPTIKRTDRGYILIDDVLVHTQDQVLAFLAGW